MPEGKEEIRGGAPGVDKECSGAVEMPDAQHCGQL